MPYFEAMTAGSLFYSLVLLLRSGSWEENMLKISVFPLMQPAQNSKENLKLRFLNTIITNDFLNLMPRLQ